MGEFIAAGIVLAALILVIGLASMFASKKGRPVDPSVTLARVVIHIPDHKTLQRVSTELSDLAASKHIGVVEFYENDNSVVRIVVD